MRFIQRKTASEFGFDVNEAKINIPKDFEAARLERNFETMKNMYMQMFDNCEEAVFSEMKRILQIFLTIPEYNYVPDWKLPNSSPIRFHKTDFEVDWIDNGVVVSFTKKHTITAFELSIEAD